MRWKHGWLIVLVVVALLVAACGPQEDVPTLGEQADRRAVSRLLAVGETPKAAAAEDPTAEPAESSASAAELPVDADDWHVLGSPDAPVTIVEYSDFQ